MNAISIIGFARDPRQEPKVGDVLEREGKVRVVSDVLFSPFAGKTFISYKGGRGGARKVSLDAWRYWASPERPSPAVIIKVAA